MRPLPGGGPISCLGTDAAPRVAPRIFDRIVRQHSRMRIKNTTPLLENARTGISKNLMQAAVQGDLALPTSACMNGSETEERE